MSIPINISVVGKNANNDYICTCTDNYYIVYEYDVIAKYFQPNQK